MVSKEFFAALDELCVAKGIDKQDFIATLQSALTSAYKKHAKCDETIVEARLNEEKCSIRCYLIKDVVDLVEDPDKQISLEDARLLKKSYKVGDKYEEEFSTKDFGRIAAQTFKQVVMQKVRVAERNNTISEFEEKENEIQAAIVRKIDGGNVYVELSGGALEGVMLPQDQLSTETYNLGDKITVYVKRVRQVGKMTQILVSRTAVGLVKRFFENEVPEIKQGVVVIKGVSRDAGQRTKIAVYSSDSNIDASGACIGNKGARVNAVIENLGGEKIDIVLWSENPLEYIANALAPAKVLKVYEIGENAARVIVPDDKLSLAIGKDGQNARLAAKLTGWKIDVKSESKALEELEIDTIE